MDNKKNETKIGMCMKILLILMIVILVMIVVNKGVFNVARMIFGN